MPEKASDATVFFDYGPWQSILTPSFDEIPAGADCFPIPHQGDPVNYGKYQCNLGTIDDNELRRIQFRVESASKVASFDLDVTARIDMNTSETDYLNDTDEATHFDF